MIVSALTDGLGNQLFQYATAHAIAQQLGVPLALDLRWFEQGKWKYGLHQFPLSARLMPPAEARAWVPDSIFNQYGSLAPRRWYQRLGHRYWLSIKSGGRRRIETDPKISTTGSIRENSFLIGFWGHERIFRDHRTSLLREFKDQSPLSPAAAAKARQIQDAVTPVAIHIRRGDKETDTCGVCPAAYYLKAWRHLAERLDRPTPFVFSDDPPKAHQILADVPSAVFIDHPDPLSSGESFALMRRCHHFVISNSTFSWWAAWLSETEPKQVVAPTLWWKSPEQLFPAVGPKEWTHF